ncbi:hypothetical protein SAMN04488540_104259 [Ferrimonas sediminum]|uniref:Uncharacterized protein n=1 Tax=Ferrimonas sediminum TaxID=718193 RepID=A0A1G8QES4_9GAMM|nr:hypothetical protein [Ferrimonas sediminum]SDJ02600.1 hypothetical protein SAMN04488540_104259 [Ferrimonas sediminum]
MLQWYPDSYRIGIAPILTLLMVFFAIGVRVLIPEGNTAFQWPLNIAMGLIALVHLYLIIDDRVMKRGDALIYGLVHICMAFTVWIFSLMVVTGNDLF